MIANEADWWWRVVIDERRMAEVVRTGFIFAWMMVMVMRTHTIS